MRRATTPSERCSIDLLEAHRRDLCVTDRNGRIVGLLGIEDLAGGEHSSFALRRELAEAPDLDALVATVNEGLPRLLTSLLSAGLGPARYHQGARRESDVVTMRLLDFAFERHGQAPVAWAWMALGSVARRELTLASDQDNAFAYSDDADQEADAFFERVATDVNDGLSRCGFGEDNAEVLARSPRWRMSARAVEGRAAGLSGAPRSLASRPGRRHLRFPARRWRAGDRA